MGFNLSGGAGAGAGAEMLQQILRQKALEFQQAEQVRMEEARLKLDAERQKGESEDRHLLMKDRQDAQASAIKAGAANRANTLADDLTPRQDLTPEAVNTLTAGDRGDLVKPATLPSTNIGGSLPRLAMTPNPGKGPTFTGTQGQLRTMQDRDQARQDKLDATAQARGDKVDAANQSKADREDLIRLTASLKPPPQQQLITIQTVDANGNAVTKVVPKTAGSEFAKGPSATLGNRLESAKVVNEVGSDIIKKLSDPKYVAAVGPAMGRASSVEDFIGNPPPEFSELAGQIHSYALANMGVHGMRSAEGAKVIDHLLSQKHTPESLAATIRGLNDFSTRLVNNNTHTPGGAAAPAVSSGSKRVRYDVNGNPIQDK